MYNTSYNGSDPEGSCAILDSTDTHNRVSSILYIISSLIFVLVGLVGNSLSILIFSSPPMRVISSSVYLLSLAVSDGFYLACVLLSKVLPNLTCWGVLGERFDVVNNHAFACVALQYLDDLFADASTCLILAFTIERCLAVYRPTRLKQLCTVPRARLVCAAILCLVAVTIMPHHVLYIRLYRNPDVCTIAEEHEATFTALYGAESVAFRIVPVIVIAALNVLIILRIGAIARTKERLRSSVRGQGGTAAELNGCCPVKKASPRHGGLQLTLMLIVVSTTYVLLHVPVLVHFVLMQLHRLHWIRLDRRHIFISLNYCRLLYVAGFAINFFLYTVSGSLFREQLVRILTPCPKPGELTGGTRGAGGSETPHEMRRIAQQHSDAAATRNTAQQDNSQMPSCAT